MRHTAGVDSRSLRRWIAGACCAVALLGGDDVLPYGQAGHFYTVSAGASMIQPPLTAAQARVVSFCAELPDHAYDLDAIRVYARIRKDSFGALRKWANDEVDPDAEWVRRMVTVQQLLHGLTGGRATAVQTVATDTIRTLRQQAAGGAVGASAAWCAVGFALHLYGDSFAHREMGGSGDDPDRMYVTGRGHAADLKYPDRPLCAQFKRNVFHWRSCESARAGRFGRWGDYWKLTLSHLAPGTAVDAAAIDGIADKVYALAENAGAFGDWGEEEMRKKLVDGGAAADIGAFLDRQGVDRSCDEVLQAALQANDALGGTAPFKCLDAWSLYHAAATQAFASVAGARAPAGLDFDAIYLANPLAPFHNH